MINDLINNPKYKNTELKSVYDRNFNRKFGIKLPIKLFGSSSKGNSLYIDPMNLLIDLGFPYKRYIEHDPMFFYDVKTIFLTHHHGDHLNPATLLKIVNNHPHIAVYISRDMLDELLKPTYKAEYKRLLDHNGKQMYEQKMTQNGMVDDKQKPIFMLDENNQRIIEKSPYKDRFERIQHKLNILDTTGGLMRFENINREPFYITPRSVKHGDIMNIALDIGFQSNRLLYVSDLDNLGEHHKLNNRLLDGLVQEKNTYDLCFIEANHDVTIIKSIQNNLEPNDYAMRARIDGSMRHLSEQESKKYFRQVAKPDALFIPLHASETFGTLKQ